MPPDSTEPPPAPFPPAPGRALVWLAPMAEITDSAFRAVAFAHGADGAVTEMVSAAGLVRGSRNTPPLLVRLAEETGPCAVQLYGSDPAELAEATRLAADTGRFDAVDLNAGCPMRRIVENGDGAALMRDEALFGRCVEAMARAAAPLPVTVKTRIGLDPARPAAARLAHVAEEAGAAAVFLHGRYASRAHDGPVDAEELRRGVAAVRVPVFVNGGVRSAADAVSLVRETGAAGVMVGRAAVGDPWLFGEIRAAFAAAAGGKESSGAPGVGAGEGGSAARANLPTAALVEALRAHLRLALALRRAQAALRGPEEPAADPEAAVALDFRRHLFRYFHGRPGSLALRRAMGAARSPEDILAAARAAFGA